MESVQAAVSDWPGQRLPSHVQALIDSEAPYVKWKSSALVCRSVDSVVELATILERFQKTTKFPEMRHEQAASEFEIAERTAYCEIDESHIYLVFFNKHKRGYALIELLPGAIKTAAKRIEIPGVAGQLRRVFRDHSGGVVSDGQSFPSAFACTVAGADGPVVVAGEVDPAAVAADLRQGGGGRYQACAGPVLRCGVADALSGALHQTYEGLGDVHAVLEATVQPLV
jgi:hypothetical protein